MTDEAIGERIGVDQGRACIRGTTVRVSEILDDLAAGKSVATIAADRQVEPESVRAALFHAARIVGEKRVAL